MAHDYHSRILSKPVRVDWAGFTSDTYTLQQAGWEISVDQDPVRMVMRMVMRHPRSNIVGQSNSIDYRLIDYMEHARGEVPLQIWQMRAMGHLFINSAEVATLYGENVWDRYKPIDAMPRMAPTSRDLQDLVHFQEAPLIRTKALILPEASVDDLLAGILERQEGAKQAYFKDLVDRESMEFPQHRIHAQIISLAA